MTKGCPKCGRMVEQIVDVCPYCNYRFSEIEKVYQMVENENKEKVSENAGLFQRLTAFSFDLLLIVAVFIGIMYIFKTFINYQNININLIYSLVIIILIYFFYSTILEATPLKGTIGMRILNIMVVDDGGYQIGLAMSFKRNIAKILNIVTIGVGYIALIFTKHKQTLSDYVSDTYVKNRKLEYNSKLYYANILLRIIAFIVDLVILYFVYFIINFLATYFINAGLITNIENTKNIVNIIIVVISIFYFVFMDSKNGTFGKQLFAFKVTNLKGEKISIFKSLLRLILMIFEILFIPIGIFICIEYPTKQTFKDLITDTVVIKIVYCK